MRSVNLNSINLIKSFESFSPKPYKDLVGVPTIGWGTTHYPSGKKVTMQDLSISEDQANFYLMFEINEKSTILDTFLNKLYLELNDNEFGAIMSFVYNVGIAPAIESGRSLNTALRSRNKNNIADSLLLYNKGTFLGVKKTIKGLVRRRIAERQLFLTPTVIKFS